MNKKFDYIVVLGFIYQKDGPLHDMFTGRLDRAIRLYKKGMAKKMILSGGVTGKEHKDSESGEMYVYMRGKGIGEDTLLIENKSLNTIGNAVFSKLLIKKDSRFRDPSLLIVTSDYHVRRSRFIFRRIFGPSCRIGFSSTKTPARFSKKAFDFERFSMKNTVANLKEIDHRSSDAKLRAVARSSASRGITEEMRKALWY